MVSIHVTGIDKCIRDFDRTIDGMDDALDKATEEAADYLIECIQDKFGSYQPDWKPLKADTIRKEKRMGFGYNASKPLVMTSDMMFSFYSQTKAKTRKHVVWILSDDPKLQWHMYGVPSKHIPKRDPVRPTTKEEQVNIVRIIKEVVAEVFK